MATFFFNKKKVNSDKVYLGLLLKEKSAIAMVIKDDGRKLSLIEKEKFELRDGWDRITEDFDKVIFQLEQKTNTHFSEIIIFAYSHLIDKKNKEIKKEYLAKIKSLIKELELKPLGYIECYEAIVDFFEKKEELPITAIILELDSTKLSLFVYKGGVLSFSNTVERTESIIKDFTGAIDEIKGKTLLPSKVIIYDSKNLDEEISKILTHQWSEEFFIQLPRVHIVKEDEIFEGLIRVFGGQVKTGLVTTPSQTIEEEKIEENDTLGFVVGKDIEEGIEKKNEVPEEEIKLKINKRSFRFKFPNPIAIIKNFVKKNNFKIPVAQNRKPNNILLPIIGILLIISAVFVNEFFFHKANLTLYLPSQSMQEELLVSDKEIPIETSTVSVLLTEDKSTTGKKEIGEKAKGTVTIHNFSNSIKTFKAGTVVDSNGLKFELDQEITATSAGTTIVGSNIVKQPGKVKVSVTALEIGPQNNIDKNHQFTIDDYPSDTFIALNEDSMTGGTKKEIRTVSKNDIDELKSLILEKGSEKNEKENKTNNKFTIISDLTQSGLKEMVFSKEIGEEADSVSLKAKVETVFSHLDNTKLLRFLSSKLEKKLISGFVLDKSRITFKIIKVKETDEATNISLKATAYAIKNVNNEKVINDVRAKRQTDLDGILKNNFEIKGFKLEMKEPLPLINQWMPFFIKNIDLKISIL